MRMGLYLGYNAKPWQTILQVSATPQHPLGSWFDDENGHVYRYALVASGQTLVAGDLVQSAPFAGAANSLQSAATVRAAVPIGETRIILRAVTDGQSASLFAEGWAGIWTSSPTASYTRRIKDNTALTTDTDAGYIDLYDPLPVALTTSDRVALMVNPYRNIIQMPTSHSGMVLGGVHIGATGGQYVWIQTKGWFAVRPVTSALAAGIPAIIGGTAGRPTVNTASAFSQFIGISNAAWPTANAGLIYLDCE